MRSESYYRPTEYNDDGRPDAQPSIDMDIGVPQRVPGGLPGGQEAPPLVTWTNRRKMAWWAFVAILAAFPVGLYCGLAIATSDRQMSLVESLYSYLAITCGGVILGYMGFTSLPFLGRSK